MASKSPQGAGNNGKPQKPAPNRPGKTAIYRRYRTTKSGKVLDAHDYGLKAWKMWV